jgi:hypothetical protein
MHLLSEQIQASWGFRLRLDLRFMHMCMHTLLFFTYIYMCVCARVRTYDPMIICAYVYVIQKRKYANCCPFKVILCVQWGQSICPGFTAGDPASIGSLRWSPCCLTLPVIADVCYSSPMPWCSYMFLGSFIPMLVSSCVLCLKPLVCTCVSGLPVASLQGSVP